MLKGDCNICINGKLPSYSASCVECGLSRKNYKPITNADRIRHLSDAELARWIATTADDNCPDTAHERYCDNRCGECWLDWLKSPADKEEEG